MQKQIDRAKARLRIRRRIRKKVSGTASRPRVAVFRSAKHIYVQAIDDENGRTLAHASSRHSDFREKKIHGGNRTAAKEVGGLLAERLKDAGVETVVFDRGGYLYHGRVRVLAEAIREGGIRF
jgi:large subunit ribosomal protein L18